MWAEQVASLESYSGPPTSSPSFRSKPPFILTVFEGDRREGGVERRGQVTFKRCDRFPWRRLLLIPAGVKCWLGPNQAEENTTGFPAHLWSCGLLASYPMMASRCLSHWLWSRPLRHPDTPLLAPAAISMCPGQGTVSSTQFQ